MERIRFSEYAMGTNYYELPVNPSSVDFQDSRDIKTLEILDGESITQESIYDSRTRLLMWRHWVCDNETISDMVSALKAYEGAVRYVSYGDIDVRLHDQTVWNKYRVQELKATYREAGRSAGGMRYNKVELTLLPSN